MSFCINVFIAFCPILFLVVFLDKKIVGKITHYFDKIGVGVIELSSELKEGDKISVEMHDGNSFEQVVSSMQINRVPVKKAKKGDAIGIKLAQPVRNANVYKLVK